MHNNFVAVSIYGTVVGVVMLQYISLQQSISYCRILSLKKIKLAQHRHCVSYCKETELQLRKCEYHQYNYHVF